MKTRRYGKISLTLAACESLALKGFVTSAFNSFIFLSVRVGCVCARYLNIRALYLLNYLIDVCMYFVI